jgi:hypothetical protein
MRFEFLNPVDEKYEPKFRGPFQKLLLVIILTSSLAYKHYHQQQKLSDNFPNVLKISKRKVESNRQSDGRSGTAAMLH